MRFEDWEDLIIAFIILVILIVVGNVLEFGSVTYTTGEINLKDEAGLFLLNYVKSETGSGKIANRIILNEGGDHTTLIPLQGLSKELLNFAEMRDKDYILKVGYPNGSVNFIAASPKWALPKAGSGLSVSGAEKLDGLSKLWFELGDGEKIKLPSLNGGLITVEFKLEDE